MNMGQSRLKIRSGRFNEGKSRAPTGNKTTTYWYSRPLPGLYIDDIKTGKPGNVTVWSEVQILC